MCPYPRLCVRARIERALAFDELLVLSLFWWLLLLVDVVLRGTIVNRTKYCY